MHTDKRISLPPFVMLFFVSIVMSFAVAGVYMLTKDTIDAAALEAQAAARSAVMEAAAAMTELPLEEGAAVDQCYEAYDADGSIVGYVSQVTAIGFGGEIEVTVGMDTQGAITAISVGGAKFSETSGLGARTREPKFTEQFRGKSGVLVLKQDIDSVTGASVSSGAVVSAVNKALDYMRRLLPGDAVLGADSEPLPLSGEDIAAVLPGAQETTWMGAAAGIDGWWQADNGHIVRATGFGEGPITVTVGFTPARVVTGLIIGDEAFMETEGRGDRVRESWYAEQFIGRSGEQAYGAGVDAISGATVTSNATLAAINACLRFDPAAPGAAVEAPTAPASAEADAVTEASPAEEEAPPLSTPEPTPDAVTEASVPEAEEPEATPEPQRRGLPQAPVLPVTAAEADAVTEASPVEEPAPTPEPTPDAVTEASIPEEEAG